MEVLFMEVIRKYIDESSLMKIMALPETFRNRRLEVIVLPAEDLQRSRKRVDMETTIRSLIGAIPDTGLSLADYREERARISCALVCGNL